MTLRLLKKFVFLINNKFRKKTNKQTDAAAGQIKVIIDMFNCSSSNNYLFYTIKSST